MLRFILCCTLLAAAPLLGREAGSTAIVRQGEPAAVIYISEKEEVGPGIRYQTSSVSEAATELVTMVRRISGAELPLERVNREALSARLAKAKEEGRTAILLGSLAVEWFGKVTPEEKAAMADVSGFVFRSTGGVVGIGGEHPRGTEIGVHELLEQVGVRWFFPGEYGTVVPVSKDLAIAPQAKAGKPSFPARHFGFNALDKDPATATWKRHQREGGLFLPPAHGIRLGQGVTPETHPQFFAKTTKVGGTVPQVCLTQEEVLPRAIKETKKYFKENPDSPWVGMGPADGSGFCECSGCRALDAGNWDPFSNEESMTDRYIWFINKVLDGISDEYPDKKVALYVYHCYIEPPVNIKPNPRIVAAVAPIGLCRIHGMNNTVCPERGYLKGIVKAWSETLPEVYERGYWFNLADPGMTFIQLHRLRDEIPYYAKYGIQGFRTECTGQWAAQGPSLYIAGKLMWDVNADVDALLTDFCEKLFGPAAEPMERFFKAADERMRDTDAHTGSAFDLTRFYPKDFRTALRAELNAAKRLATASPYKERVSIFSQGFAFTEHFSAMLEARDAHRWAEAHEHLQQCDAIRGEMEAMQPPMFSRQAEAYLRRFFRIPVEQGYARSQGGNALVAPLADEWEALIDPQQIGASLHYEQPEITGGNWQRTPTFSTTWSHLGLRYYKGLAWYRQTVDVGEKDAAKRLFLWLGGVDESARVWVNGKLLGTSVPSAFTPFELDATGAVKSGKNEIVLCVANLRTNELGTGGITAPGFLYAPAAGAKAELENLKPLRETFP